MSLRQQFAYLIRYMPILLEIRINEWLVGVHRPQDIGGGTAVCLNGHGWRKTTPWPCGEAVEAARRIEDLRARLS